MIPFQLNSLSFDDFLLYGILSNKSVNIYRALLPDSVSSIHGLQIHLRVPITIVNDDCICTR
jgi:hypothetical protein